MKTTIQKFKALLKARKDSDCESILAKCSIDEMQKFASVLKVKTINGDCRTVLVIFLVGALDKRRFERNLLLSREKFLKGLRF